MKQHIRIGHRDILYYYAYIPYALSEFLNVKQHIRIGHRDISYFFVWIPYALSVFNYEAAYLHLSQGYLIP